MPQRVPSTSSNSKCESLSSTTKPSSNEHTVRTGGKEEDSAAVHEKIEAQLKRDNEVYKKTEARMVKLLLLGQAGSGKSTTLKNFRMRFTRDEWEQERLGWRAIVQLNIVRQVLSILQIVDSELGGSSITPPSQEDTRAVVDDTVRAWISESPLPEPWLSPVLSSDTRTQFTDKHRDLVMRLSPRLFEVEQELQSRLAPHKVYYPTMTTPRVSATPFEPVEELDDDMLIRRKVTEYNFRSWRDVLTAAPKSLSSSSNLTQVGGMSSLYSKGYMDMPTQAIASLREDIKVLWADHAIRAVLQRRRLEIPDSIGFDSDAESTFLDEIDRIAQVDYEVTDQDIVCARLKTVGIQEYTFHFETGAPTITGKASWSWRIYDVGGCRTMRKAWLPYFDNVQVIIFLAPVSVFDERLEEDPRVNRLHDSIVLWSCICETALLANTQIILFLNKCDLLEKKLHRGVRVAKYLSSYGKRPNTLKHVIRYIREKFKIIHEEKSPSERAFVAYPTTVTDTSSTALTLKTGEQIRPLYLYVESPTLPVSSR
ncbi:Guanine nucleotide-binding protein alpha-4 subunit [Leucoagaricus sp. SymC.cos]|nr:Guanine nucleotide-binding protein alpha-4 subunit [Leucoagaricus sp. SymC.cos]